jgi:hypothetical protein
MQALIPTSNDITTTAPVTLPPITLETFSALVLQMQAQAPASASRLERGAAIVTKAGAIWETTRDGLYQIESCTERGAYYRVTSYGCGCKDWTRAPGLTCEHVAAIQIIHAASVIAAREANELRYWPTAGGAA